MPNWRDCGKCGEFLDESIGRGAELVEPWCWQCRRKHSDEYAAILTKWVMENAGPVLAAIGVPPAYQSCSFESLEAKTEEQRQALRVTKAWVNSETPGLFLCGPVGTGKSHLAVSALLAMRARRSECRC